MQHLVYANFYFFHMSLVISLLQSPLFLFYKPAVLGKLSYWFLVSWWWNENIFNKQPFHCCFANYSISTLADWSK